MITVTNPRKALFSRKSAHWATPSHLYQELHKEFRFDFDPCPIDGDEDGLSFCTIWEGRRVFCNPTYGRGIADWLQRGLEADLAVFLLPARTDTAWFHNFVLPHAKEIRFIRGRLKFGNRAEKAEAAHGSIGAPFPSMLIVFERPKR